MDQVDTEMSMMPVKAENPREAYAGSNSRSNLGRRRGMYVSSSLNVSDLAQSINDRQETGDDD